MERRICTVLVLAGCLLLVCTGSQAVRLGDDIRTVRPEAKPTEIHSKDDGWAELPSIAITREFAYVAYDVREGYESHVYLCRIHRDGSGALRTIRIDRDGEIEFAPSVCVDGAGDVWVAWSSYRNHGWSVRASRVADMEPAGELVLSRGGGLRSQVRVDSEEGVTCFCWIEWDGGGCRVMAARYETGLGEPVVVYESTNPVARADLLLFGAGRTAFVWDEYVNGHHTIQAREASGGRLMPVHRVSGARPSYSWEPRLAGSGQTCLATWQSVPDGDTKCRPAAALRGGTAIENGIDRPEDSETWRVGCFTDDAGQAWIAWVTRIMYRSTKLYLRRISASGMSEACTIEIPMQKNFINTFDCQADRNVALAWEYSGSVFFIEFGIPSLRDEEGSPEVAGSAPPESLKVSLCPEPLAYTTEYGSEQLHVYFGDYHNHTSFSDGRAYPDISMLLGRDHRCLDFICITDHDVTLTPGEFAWNNTVADLLTENGTYVCLHGYEPSKGWAQHDFGHWNMLYPGDGQVFQFEEGMTPRDLNAYAAAHNAVLIPHHVGKKFAPYDWDYFDPDVERVVETCSIQGIFETYKGNEDQPDMVPGKFIQDGLARGYRFGLVAGSDYHNCFAALRDECGLTGVYVPALDAASIFEALKKRRTFALTGSRIVVDFRCNGKFMGEEVKGAEGLRFSCYAASPDIISAVRIVSDGVTVFEQTYDLPEVSFAWETEAPDHEAYYYLRAMTSKGDYAWSSPIWSVPAQ